MRDEVKELKEKKAHPAERRGIGTPEIDKGKNKAGISTAKHAAILNTHFRRGNYVKVKPPPLLARLPDAFAVSYLTERGTDCRTFGQFLTYKLIRNCAWCCSVPVM